MTVNLWPSIATSNESIAGEWQYSLLAVTAPVVAAVSGPGAVTSEVMEGSQEAASERARGLR